MDPQALGSSPLTAQCQLHPGQPFTAVCQRCGTYMCSVCTEGGRHTLCAACRARGDATTFPFRRDNYSLGGLMEFSWRAYKENFAVITLSMVVGIVLVVGVSMLGPLMTLLLKDAPLLIALVQAILFVPQLILQGMFTLGMLAVAIKAVRGERPELADLFATYKLLGRWMMQSFVVMVLLLPVVIVGGGLAFAVATMAGETSGMIAGAAIALLLVPVVMYGMLGLAFGNMELVGQPGMGAVAGLRNSWSIARGHRLFIFLVGLTALALYLGGILACVVGLLFTLGYASCLFASLYLALRNGAEELHA